MPVTAFLQENHRPRGQKQHRSHTLPGNTKRKHFAAQLASSIPSQETLTRALYPSHRQVSLRGSWESPQQNVSQSTPTYPTSTKRPTGQIELSSTRGHGTGLILGGRPLEAEAVGGTARRDLLRTPPLGPNRQVQGSQHESQ